METERKLEIKFKIFKISTVNFAVGQVGEREIIQIFFFCNLNINISIGPQRNT